MNKEDQVLYDKVGALKGVTTTESMSWEEKLSHNDAIAKFMGRFEELANAIELRDKIAMRAMERLLERGIYEDMENGDTKLAGTAYRLADAMLNARKTK